MTSSVFFFQYSDAVSILWNAARCGAYGAGEVCEVSYDFIQRISKFGAFGAYDADDAECLHLAHQYQIAGDQTSEPDNHFGILVFAQKWPITACKYWMHGTGGQCVYPNQKNRWTVHGIWPSTVEGSYTDFCNNSWAFDPEQIKAIENDLEQAWTNNFKEDTTYRFWGHEWLKHGTCAAVLEPFNSQFKYFSKGIEWNQKYSLLDMLDAANIFPSDTKEFTLEVLVSAVKAKTKKDPMVVCDLFDEVHFLEELRICFDIQLNLIDCYPVVDSSCDVSKGIIFPASA